MTVSHLSGVSGAALPPTRVGSVATLDAGRALTGALIDPALLGSARAAALASHFPVASDAITLAGAASQFAAAFGGSDPVTLGRVEAAALDFAAETRALLVAGLDQSPDALAAMIGAALDAGSAHAAGGVALDLADALHHAAHLLGEQGAAPLFISPVAEEF